MNNIVLTGKVHSHPRPWSGNSSSPLYFILAVTDPPSSEEHSPRTNFIPVLLFNEEAGRASATMRQGDAITVIGRLRALDDNSQHPVRVHARVWYCAYVPGNGSAPHINSESVSL